jgi:hypothetical protein
LERFDGDFMKRAVDFLIASSEGDYGLYRFEQRNLVGWAEAIERAKRAVQQKHGLNCSYADATL